MQIASREYTRLVLQLRFCSVWKSALCEENERLNFFPEKVSHKGDFKNSRRLDAELL
jgi:hypothetical protein